MSLSRGRGERMVGEISTWTAQGAKPRPCIPFIILPPPSGAHLTKNVKKVPPPPCSPLQHLTSLARKRLQLMLTVPSNYVPRSLRRAEPLLPGETDHPRGASGHSICINRSV